MAEQANKKPIAIVILAANVGISVIEGGIASKERHFINNTELSITPATNEVQSIISTRRDDRGQALATYDGEPTPAEVTIAFNHAPPEVFALAMGGSIERVEGKSGKATDEAVPQTPVNGIIHLNNLGINRDTLAFKSAAGVVTLTAGKDFEIVHAFFGEVRVLSEEMAALEDVTVSYDYNQPGSTVLSLGTRTSFTMNVQFTGTNATDGSPVRGEIYNCTVTPTEPIDLHSGEPVTATLTGKIVKPEEKKDSYRVELFDAIEE